MNKETATSYTVEDPFLLPSQTTLVTLPEQFRMFGSRELVASCGLVSSSKKSLEHVLGTCVDHILRLRKC